MSLLSIDLRKAKKLSLRQVKAPAPAAKAPTAEETAYSRLIASNPLVRQLIERLDLIRIDTPQPQEEPIDSPKLIALAFKILEGERAYTQEKIVEEILEETGVNRDRAERGFKRMLQAGAIAPTLGESYYLTGSTPF